MIPVGQTFTGTLVFLNCGCAGWRHLTHPTGAAVLVGIVRRCQAHADEAIEFRAVPASEPVKPWVQVPTQLEPLRAR